MSTLPDTPAGTALAALLARRGQAYYDQFRTFHLTLFAEHQAVIAAAGAERAAAELAVTAAQAQVTLANTARQAAENAAAVAVAAAGSIAGGPVASVNGQPGPNVVLTAPDVGALPADADVVGLAMLHAYTFA